MMTQMIQHMVLGSIKCESVSLFTIIFSTLHFLILQYNYVIYIMEVLKVPHYLKRLG
jgi:hypothetical protein